MDELELKDYLASERGRAVQLARHLGKSSAFVNQMASGKRPVPADLCLAIAEASEQRVPVWKLRPNDWHRIWPHLIGHPGLAPTHKAPTKPKKVRDAA